jgi:outer membrane receptor protein involved in Fe transport
VATVDLERIEAVSGPQPTTYGASAQSGVLKFVTARPVLSEFGGFVEVSGSAMQEGDAGYELQGAVNIPIIDDVLALRVTGMQSKIGGYVDNIAGSSLQTHDWQPAWDSVPADAAYPGGSLAASGIAHVTKTNHDVAEDNIGDVETEVLRLTAAWQLNDDWLVTAMAHIQSTHVDGIASWHPGLGDLNQIRFKNETNDDDWYITTLVFEGDLGFADFTSATGYMDREVVYDLDSSTYLHQFQGIGGVYYNMLDIAYFPAGVYNADLDTCVYYGNVGAPCYIPIAYTSFYPAYNGSITGWTSQGPNDNGYPTYFITELTDNTSSMFDRSESQRFTQELRLTSNNPDARFQWMLGAFYEKFESNYVFRGLVDNFGDSIVGQTVALDPGFVVRSPGQSWYGRGNTEETEWSVFAEIGFDITDNLNLLVGARYFEADADNANLTLNQDGTKSQNCLEELVPGFVLGVPTLVGECVTSPANVTPDNRIGTAAAFNSASNSDTLPLVTLSYSMNDDVLTYFTRSEGFRVGGTNIIRSVSTASNKYDPDKIINNEIGLKMNLWDGRIVWNIAAYSMTWEDMQMVAADPTISFGWGQVTVNTGEADLEGVETNFAIAASERWRFNGAFTYNTSEVTEGATIGDDVVVSVGEQLPLSPRIKWTVGAEYTFPVKNSDAYVRLDWSYTDEQTNATQGSTLLTSSTLLRGTITTMPSYSMGNLIAGIGNGEWSVRFAVNNFTDERAVTYVPTRWTDGRQYTVRPREFTLTYRKNW